MAEEATGWDTGPAPLQVGMLLYPRFTLLDLAGPQTAFGIVGQTHLIGKTMDPVPTDMGVSMNPTVTLDNVPDNLDVLFVPGGFGTNDTMQDQEILDFPRARWFDRPLYYFSLHGLGHTRHGRPARRLSCCHSLGVLRAARSLGH